MEPLISENDVNFESSTVKSPYGRRIIYITVHLTACTKTMKQGGTFHLADINTSPGSSHQLMGGLRYRFNGASSKGFLIPHADPVEQWLRLVAFRVCR
jgi:hypothetical protein